MCSHEKSCGRMHALLGNEQGEEKEHKLRKNIERVNHNIVGGH